MLNNNDFFEEVKKVILIKKNEPTDVLEDKIEKLTEQIKNLQTKIEKKNKQNGN